MKPFPLVLALILSAAAPVSATTHEAHAPPPAGKAVVPHSSADAFGSYDKNKDGWLSRAELANHPMAGHASMFDADKDGRLTRAEFQKLQSM